MPNQLSENFRTKVPIWLFTVNLPGVLTLRYALPEPLDAFYEITNDLGEVFRYGPGVLSEPPRIINSLIGATPSYTMAFQLPQQIEYKPADVDWSSATVEIAQWFEGDSFDDRIVRLNDLLQVPEVGAIDEPITGTVSYLSEDLGRLLDPESRITPETFPDVGDLVGDRPATAAFDDTQRFRAWRSDGLYYGEIIGRPDTVQLRIVRNDNLADPGVTDYTPFFAIVCDDVLRAVGNRGLQFYTTSRSNQLWKFTPASGLYLETTDERGRKVTLLEVSASIQHATTSAGPLFVPSSITTNPQRFIANTNFNGSWIAPGDQVRRSGDIDSWFRVITDIEGGNPDDANYYNVMSLNGDYGTLTSPTDDDTIGALDVIALPESNDRIFLDCSVVGGRPMDGDPSRDLRDANDVLWTYLQRSEGIRVDLANILTLDVINDYKIDGHLVDGDQSPLDWVRSDLLPILPIAPSWEGAGLRFRYIGQDNRNPDWFLTLGRDGPDGDRLSGRPTQDLSVVVNDLTVKYRFRPDSRTFTATLTTAKGGYNNFAQNPALQGREVVNNRALESQVKYGLRSATIETVWVSEEATARKIATQILDRKHKPRWRILYQLRREYGGFEVGDVAVITDSEVGIESAKVLAIEVTHTQEGPVVLFEESD